MKFLTEGSLEIKLPAVWTDEKQRWEESEKKVRKERHRREQKKRNDQSMKRRKVRNSQKQEDAGARTGRKVVKHSLCFYNDLRLGRVEK